MKHFLCSLVFISLLFVSCVNEANQSPTGEPELLAAVTGEATGISCRNAVLAGKANLPSTISEDTSFGVLYSTSSGVLVASSIQVPATTFDSNYNFSVETEILEPETVYYYRTYISQMGVISYGVVKSFQTLSVGSMIQTNDATDVTPNSAQLHAVLDLTNCKYQTKEFGFEVTPEGGETHTVKTSTLSDKEFSAKDNSLTKEKQYSYVSFVTLDGRTYKGEAKKFTTGSIVASITVESSDVKCISATVTGKLTVETSGSFDKKVNIYYSSTEQTLESLISGGTKHFMYPSTRSKDKYNYDLPNLDSDTRYYYVCEAKIDDACFYSEVKSFKTEKIQASISAESSNVRCNGATISGKLTIAGEEKFSKSATLYHSPKAYTVESLKADGLYEPISFDEDGAYSIVAESVNDNTKQYYCVVVKINNIELCSEVKTFITTSFPIPELVDLGLSVKWATCNLGAYKPEEKGGVYQYAGLEDVASKSIYLSWDHCPYADTSTGKVLWKKYVLSYYYFYWAGPGDPDDKLVLDAEDDVAHVKLGGNFRIPTKAEWLELFNLSNCSIQCVSDYNGTGVGGAIITSKKAGYTDKSIFLPAYGWRTEGIVKAAAESGDFQSATISDSQYNQDPYFAYSASADIKHKGAGGGRECRYYGFSVRSVSK